MICLNVIEHVEDDRAALSNIKKVLARDGCAIILVPQGAWNYGSLDKVLGHIRRYSAATLQELASDCGLTISHLVGFNRVGSAVWFLNGRIVRRKAFGFMEMWFLNWLTPIFRLMDKLLPLPPLSLIAVMENQHSDKKYSTDSHAVYDDHRRPNPLNDTYLRPSEHFPSAPEHAANDQDLGYRRCQDSPGDPMVRDRMSSRARELLTFAIIAISGVGFRAVSLLKTGIDFAVAPDSVGYIGLADGLRKGCGFARLINGACSAPRFCALPGFP